MADIGKLQVSAILIADISSAIKKHSNECFFIAAA
jgi:hypothetical protein